MKPITVAIAGCGSRGLDTYAACEARFPEKMKIVAAADIKPEKLQQIRERNGLTEVQCYDSAEEMFKQGRLADVCFICTQDEQHHAHAMEALNLGYHLLLEKPIAPKAWECKDIERLANEKGLMVVVCHVLRYTVFYQTIKKLIDEGAIGDVVNVQACEQVGYYHQAHSFVRGNWNKKEERSPMILAKCCHDMDMLLWLTGKRCKRVSSFGSLKHFRADRAPEGAPKRCTDGCPAAETCPYNAEAYYMGQIREGKLGWPVNIVTAYPSEETVMEALKTGPYGRCVYQCDNDVVDHQIVNLEMEDEVTISFTMSAFTAVQTRTIDIMGTTGEIEGVMAENIIRLKPFGKPVQEIDVTKLTTDFSGHGGGDARMIEELLDILAGRSEGSPSLTSISRSVESHMVALAAEESRLNNGAPVDMATFNPVKGE